MSKLKTPQAKKIALYKWERRQYSSRHGRHNQRDTLNIWRRKNRRVHRTALRNLQSNREWDSAGEIPHKDPRIDRMAFGYWRCAKSIPIRKYLERQGEKRRIYRWESLVHVLYSLECTTVYKWRNPYHKL